MSRTSFSMYRRGANGRYYVQLWDQKTKRYLPAKSTGTTNRPKARAIARNMAQDYKDHCVESANPPFTSYLLVTWDWDESPYVRSRLARRPDGLTHAYVQTNHSFIARYAVPFFTGTKLSEISTCRLEAFLLHLKESTKLAPKSINSIYDAVAIPIREAFRLGVIPTDPTRPIRKLWVPHTEKGIPSTAEIRALSSMQWPDTRAKVAFLTATVCGLRLGEIRGLQKEDIGDDTLAVQHSFSVVDGLKAPKNGRPRVVPLPAFLRDELRDLVSRNPHAEEWVFWGKTSGHPLSPGVIADGFSNALAAIGVDEEQRKARHLSFHSLRHFCNAMLRGAVPDEKLRLLTGHLTESMTERYDHVTDLDRAMLYEAQETRIVSIIGRSA